MDLDTDFQRGAVICTDGHETWVRPYPLAIDVEGFERGRRQRRRWREHEAEILRRRREHLILRVDRADLSKNVLRGFTAFDIFLEQHPEFRERVTFIAHLQPSRQDVPEYVEYLEKIEALVAVINHRHGTTDWMPIDLRLRDDFEEAVALYKHFDLLLVNAMWDGMNLVSKEGPLVNTRNGMMILSENTGAHEELGDCALSVNPFDVQEQADAIYCALTGLAGGARAAHAAPARRSSPPARRPTGSTTSSPTSRRSGARRRRHVGARRRRYRSRGANSPPRHRATLREAAARTAPAARSRDRRWWRTAAARRCRRGRGVAAAWDAAVGRSRGAGRARRVRRGCVGSAAAAGRGRARAASAHADVAAAARRRPRRASTRPRASGDRGAAATAQAAPRCPSGSGPRAAARSRLRGRRRHLVPEAVRSEPPIHPSATAASAILGRRDGPLPTT